RESDDTNTRVLTGFNAGQFIVTKTIAASAVQSASTAPSILNSLTGRRPTSTTSTRTNTGSGASTRTTTTNAAPHGPQPF
ncbi:MAG: hypothetical protein WCK03_00920, partial [Candidatus Taylorbacteria bacterium]